MSYHDDDAEQGCGLLIVIAAISSVLVIWWVFGQFAGVLAAVAAIVMLTLMIFEGPRRG